jgi:drug/metabolite transporter (DMT)-like permease
MPSLFSFWMFLAMLFWAGGWSALKLLTNAVPLEVLTFWRYFIMMLSFLPILFLFKTPIRLPRKGVKYIVAAAVLNILFMFFAYLGVDYSYAGSGGVIITILSPLFTFIIGMLFFKCQHTKFQLFGLLLGLLGGMIMLNIFSQVPHSFLAELYFALSALTWAGITLLAQRAQLHIHPVHYSFFISVCASILLGFMCLPYELGSVFQQDTQFWISLLYLSIFGQTLATTIFFIGSAKLGSAKASSFMFLVPILSLVISYIVLDEPLQAHILLGGGISMLAVYFINRVPKKEKS